MGEEKLIVEKGFFETKLSDKEGNTIEFPNGSAVNAGFAIAGGKYQITLADGQKVLVPMGDIVKGLDLNSGELLSTSMPLTPTNITIPEGAIRKVAEAALDKGEGR